jgi:hypothetical protein
MAVVASAPVVARPKEFALHPFWDRENRVLFTAVGALAAADFCTTRANLASGGRELNPVTRVFSGSTPGLATNFARETASTIGISYMFHKTGHHKLERITSIRQHWHLCRRCGVWPDPSIVPRYRLVVPVAAVLLLDFDILSRP